VTVCSSYRNITETYLWTNYRKAIAVDAVHSNHAYIRYYVNFVLYFHALYVCIVYALLLAIAQARIRSSVIFFSFSSEIRSLYIYCIARQNMRQKILPFLKVLSSEMDLAESIGSVDRSSLKSEAWKFQKNRSVPHPVKAF
jgi:hypothetical protein